MSTMIDEEVDLGVDVETAGDMVVTLQLRPGGLDRYLESIRDRAGPRIKCLDGSLTLVSPSHRHERGGERLDSIVKMICDEFDIDYRAASSTLYRPRGREDDGIEPDLSYWIEHAADALDVGDHFDPGRTPPPDLLIEVVVSHGPAQSLEICRLLSIPEVWVHRPRGGKLQFLHLEDGRYVARKRSRSFPFLGPEDVLSWLRSPDDESDNKWKRRLRDWVRAELGPRRAGG